MLNRERRLAPPPWAAPDRGRAGERLRAAVAGLQELELLKVRQRELVMRALGTEAAPVQVGAEEQRLEATLSALKEQLSHLRKQDVGLKVHLQHLDRQINELKLDVSKASSEQLETDSRPSSGFYELSDTGSCSLSNSCNSMCSDLTSSSQGSLMYRGQLGPGKGSGRPESRPQSADEITVRMAGLVPQGRRPGRGIRTTADPVPPLNFGRLGFARPRPVSTGDLERFVPLQKECKSSEQKGVQTDDVLDWKYCCNLVSKNSGDVYNYPSPLHAVALQSPLFSLSSRVLGVEDKYCLSGTAFTCPESKLVPPEAGLGCLNNQTERAQLSRGEGSCVPVSPNAVCEGMLAGSTEARKDICVYNKIRGKHEKMPAQCRGDNWQGAGLQGETPAKTNLSHRELSGGADTSAPAGRLGGDSEVAGSDWQLRPAVRGLITAGSCLGLRVAHGASSSSLPMAHGSGSCLGLSTNQGAGNCLGVPTTQGVGSCLGTSNAQGAGSSYGLVDLSVSSQPTSQAPGFPGADISHGMGRNGRCGVTQDGFVQARFVGPESQLRLPRWPPSGKAKVTRIKRRGSEAGQCGVGPEAVLRAVTEGNRPGKHGAQLQCPPLAQTPACTGWELAMRPSPPPVGRVALGRRPAPQRRVGRRLSGNRGTCAGRRRELGSRLSGFSDSEQSDRGSLSHTAVAGSRSSADECSDHTADRFGDAESSGSECGQPAPQAGDQHALGNRGRRSEARICRIKASRALKKKIRKFQPEALKVMTTV
ncbi:uncharacterized protein [Mobula birostris]|uniref:uncharacterized protein isoform X1 n=2 Tax=Mobula birostris TaxID=1983395 RepID=UPI003B27B68A